VWRLGPGEETPARLAPRESAAWFARPTVKESADAAVARRPYRIAPSRAAVEWTEIAETLAGRMAGGFSAPESIGDRLPLGKTSGVSWNAVGDAVHAFLAADVPELTREARLSRAERLLAASEVVAVLRPESLLRAGDQLCAWVHAKWPGATWHREIPVTALVGRETPVPSARPNAKAGERRVLGTIDLLLTTKDGAAIVDHKSYPGDRKERASSRHIWPPMRTCSARRRSTSLGSGCISRSGRASRGWGKAEPSRRIA
jgi:hypothetical protein